MKTVIVLIEKTFVCPVAAEIPDWWDEETARDHLSTPESLGLLEDVADPDGWEEADEEPAFRAVCAPGGPVNPVLSFDEDEPQPPDPNQEALPI